MADDPSRIRVVYVAHAFHVGGAEEMVLNLVRHLPRRFEPSVCCIHHAGPIGEEIRRTGVPVTALGLTPGLRHLSDIVALQRYLKGLAPRIVHTFLLTGSLYGRLAAMLARVPIVIGSEVNIYAGKRWHHALAERLLMAATDRVVVSAESVRAFYIDQIHADPSKVEVIYNAVDFAQAQATVSREAMLGTLGVPGDVPVVGIIARLTEQKGHRYLFEALAERPELATVHLIVIGDGESRACLEQQVESRGLASRVHFLGARRDLGNVLGAIDVFAMPSLWEGLPLSLVLAMSAGVPVVATRVAGIPEVVEDRRTGLLVPPGDAAALGEALAALIADAGLRRQIARDGRAAVLPRFGVDTYVAAIADLYDRLLNGVAKSTAVASSV